MHRHTPGPSKVLVISKIMHLDVDQKFSPVPICHIQKCIYFCMYISVICLVVITQVIRHSFAGHQGLASVRAKLTNTIS